MRENPCSLCGKEPENLLPRLLWRLCQEGTSPLGDNDLAFEAQPIEQRQGVGSHLAARGAPADDEDFGCAFSRQRKEPVPDLPGVLDGFDADGARPAL